MILQISVYVKGSCLDDFIGDSYCDDENNNEGCNYDEGEIILNLVKCEIQRRPAAITWFQLWFLFKKGIAV